MHFDSFRPVIRLVLDHVFPNSSRMLTEIYIEALLVDEELADMVWELWDAGLIPDEVAAWAWCILGACSDR